MKISCMIVDDQQDCIDLLCQYADRVPDLEVKFVTTKAIEGLTYIANNAVDLLFLDIEMPDFTGIDFIKGLQEYDISQRPQVVFTTGYARYAIEGFEYDILDFLTKPVFFPRFYKALQRARRNLTVSYTKSDEYIFIEHRGCKRKIWLRDILFVRGDGNYLYLNTTEGEYRLYESLQKMEEQLPTANFCRIHKSYIVAVDRVSRYSGRTVSLAEYEDTLPVGATFRASFEKKMHFN